MKSRPIVIRIGAGQGRIEGTPVQADGDRGRLIVVTDEGHPSDSRAQRDAEVAIIAALSAQLGEPLAKTSVATGNGGRIELDGSTADFSILVEAYAHQGALRGGQSKKLATDALKLTWIGRQVGAKRLILAVADHEVESYLKRPTAWLTQALIDLEVEVIRVDLDDATVSGLRTAQTAQFR